MRHSLSPNGSALGLTVAGRVTSAMTLRQPSRHASPLGVRRQNTAKRKETVLPRHMSEDCMQALMSSSSFILAQSLSVTRGE